MAWHEEDGEEGEGGSRGRVEEGAGREWEEKREGGGEGEKVEEAKQVFWTSAEVVTQLFWPLQGHHYKLLGLSQPIKGHTTVIKFPLGQSMSDQSSI